MTAAKARVTDLDGAPQPIMIALEIGQKRLVGFVEVEMLLQLSGIGDILVAAILGDLVRR